MPRFIFSDEYRVSNDQVVKELRFHPLEDYPEYMVPDAFVDDNNAKAMSEMTCIEFHGIEISELEAMQKSGEVSKKHTLSGENNVF